MSKKTLYEYFKKQGLNDYGASGLMANIQAESGFKANNLQNTGNKSLGMTDEEYTRALDEGRITRDEFANQHKSGYGLCQWTYPTRKAAFYDFMKKNAKSFGEEMKQAEFLVYELKNRYKSVWNTLCNAKSVREASNIVLLKYERPADQSIGVQDKRAGFGEAIYNEFCNVKLVKVEVAVLKRGCKGNRVVVLQSILNGLGYNCGDVDGSFGSKTLSAVQKFQKEKELAVDGSVSAKTWTELLKG